MKRIFILYYIKNKHFDHIDFIPSFHKYDGCLSKLHSYIINRALEGYTITGDKIDSFKIDVLDDEKK